ncbi:MAG: ATP-binding protein [Polyangiales bacterium]
MCFFWLAWFGASSAVADDGGVGAPQALPDQASAQASGALGAPSGTNPATTAPATALAMDQGASSAAEARVAALTARRARVLALLDGTLDTQFAASDVLRVPLDDVDLVGEGGQRFFALLGRLRAEAGLADAARRRAEQARARAVAREPDPVVRAADGLLDALARFLLLPESERAAVVARHEARREAARAREAAVRPRVEELQRQAQQLTAYMRLELDPEVDPAPLLTLDLSANDELGGSHVRAAHLARDGSDAADHDASALTDPLARAELGFDRARRAYLELSSARKAELASVHRARQQAHREAERARAEAEAAAARRSAAATEVHDAVDAREAALEEARRARSAALRRVAEARAGLLGVRERQARRLVDLDEELAADEARHGQVTSLLDEVTSLERRSLLEGDKAADARTLLARVHARWSSTRQLWHEQQSRMTGGDLRVPLPGELPDELGDAADELVSLRAELVEEGEGLQDRVRRAEAEMERGLHADSVALNHARLRLLDLVHPEVRDTFTGFGAAGVAETRSEAEQIGLRARHTSLAWPSIVSGARDAVESSALHAGLLVFKVLLLFLGFRWWRKHGEAVLQGLGEEGMMFYLRRVRGPVEWLLLYAAIVYATGAGEVPGVATLTTVLSWTMGGATAILLLDAFAQRYHLGLGQRSRTAELRLRSLRLIGRAVVGVGLVLDLTQQAVGRGAIYAWVIRLCWLLAVPLLAVILRWWKRSIFRSLRLEGDPNRLVRWAREREKKLFGYPAAAVGGAYLLAMSIARVTLALAGRADLTQRLRAQLFRRRALRSDEDPTSPRTPVDRAVYARFEPFRAPTESLEGIAPAELDALRELLRAKQTSLSVVVGERGMGKTTFLRRLADQLGDTRVYRLSSPDTFAELVTLLAEQFGVEDSPAAVALHVRAAGPIAICIDDLHRMIMPAIGGLAELDQLVTYAREMGGDAAWVFAVEGPAWQYVERARGEHIFFDRVIQLPKWSVGDIGRLIRARSAEAGVEPCFDGVVVPRHPDGSVDEEVTQKAEGFYGVVWDFAGGNPAVALHCFRESLFENPEEANEPLVRLFREPAAEPLELLPGPMLYVLRAVLQLELARPDDIVQCTALPASDVADALRLGLSRGYIESVPEENAVRVDFHWFRPLTSVLRRKHLLVE